MSEITMDTESHYGAGHRLETARTEEGVMPFFDVTLIERVVTADEVTFSVAAASAEAAARLVLAAVPDDTEPNGVRRVRLPDGQEGGLEPEEVTHGEITARVSFAGVDECCGEFGPSSFYDPGIVEARALRRVLERAILDTTYPEGHAVSQRLLLWLREQGA
ncbi:MULTISPECIES: hypothetical protein [Acetobacter]|uniref:hypothetical protein n=1 Tax=Acetobacter TaxID=434 RepID=UPI0007780DBA|nr:MULTISPECIES: hypothetical protein [Acetobacter]